MNVTVDHIVTAAGYIKDFIEQREVRSINTLRALDGFRDSYLSVDDKESVNFKRAMVIGYSLPEVGSILECSVETTNCICVMVRASFIIGNYGVREMGKDYLMIQSRIFSPGTIPVLRRALVQLQSIR